MSNTIKIKRGNKANLGSAGVVDGELKYTKDTKELFIGNGTTNEKIGGNPLDFPISTATQSALDLRALVTETGHKIDLEIDSTNFKVVAKLYDKNNTLLSTSNEIDLPLESVVVSGRYDSLTKEVVLTLQSGGVIRFSVADLVSGLQTQIDSTHKLSSDLVDDAGNTNKFVTQSEKALITTNATDIANIKDGTDIDSFADVEEELAKKQNTIDVEHKLSANLIEENTNKKFVSEAEKTTWSNKQNAISDLETIRSGASAGATAVQDNAYVHTDNNYTNADKQKLAGLNNYDDTVVRGLITAETSRATSQENKALYFKGAFDSDDGKTRQTWEVDLGSLDWEYQSDRQLFRAISPSSCIVATDNDTTYNIKCSKYTSVSFGDQYNKTTQKTIALGSYWTGYVSVYDTTMGTDANAFKVAMSGVMLQYELSSPYIDTPIENQSILPLDTNMANKIRQRVVDGLNKIDVPNYTNAPSYNAWQILGVTKVDVNTKLWISFKYQQSVSGNGGLFLVQNTEPTIPYSIDYPNLGDKLLRTFEYGFVGRMFDVSELTSLITMPYVMLAFRSRNNKTFTIQDVMLSEKNYPYEPFNQKEHTTNAEATLLKNEYEKSSNLCDYNARLLNTQINGGTGAVDTVSGYWSCIIPIKPNTPYVISNIGGSGAVIWNGTPSTSTFVTLVNRSFVSPSNAKYLGFTRPDSETGIPMVNKGTTPEPYQKHYGEIVHKADLATLLWTNPNPNSDFEAQPIDVNMTNYKYIIIEYKRISDSDWQETAIKKLGVAVRPREAQIGFSLFEVDIAGDIYYRPISFASLTQLDILNARYKPDNSSANGWLIPVKIYGTNIP